MSELNPHNKRRSRRLPFRKLIKYGNKKSQHRGYTINLSRHGMVIESSRTYTENTPIIIEILDSLNDNKDINATTKVLGKVVWYNKGISQTSRMGIEFLTYSQDLELEYESKEYR